MIIILVYVNHVQIVSVSWSWSWSWRPWSLVCMVEIFHLVGVPSIGMGYQSWLEHNKMWSISCAKSIVLPTLIGVLQIQNSNVWRGQQNGRDGRGEAPAVAVCQGTRHGAMATRPLFLLFSPFYECFISNVFPLCMFFAIFAYMCWTIKKHSVACFSTQHWVSFV